ncbi:MAG: class I SAM-dependent methyltransferase [Lacunisphaera sp.]|nr:class I SAM-dependent methyltransferase [Lacunisphaera sp.]
MAATSANCFNALAADTRWHAFTREEKRTVAAFVRRWGIQRGQRVLEPGCGAGRLTAVLARQTGRAGRVVAFDASREFIRVAEQRGLPAQVSLHRARVQAFPLPPAEFDHIVCFNVFPHLLPQAAVTRRLVAALKPGGFFWIAHTCSRKFVNAVHRGGPPSIRAHLLPAPGSLARLLRAAGLDGIEIEDAAGHFSARAIRPAPPSA